MFTENELDISNKSYTNKDFQTIYPELLDLVKTLTNKWDPTTSNESDPGVVLIKLAALIADKNNYNIDKNILELFPLSVTQRGNAHKLYDMLGYQMKWYRSATTKVGFTYTGAEDLSEVSLCLPKWTLITDDSGDIVYTLLKQVNFSARNQLEEGEVIQGVIQDYEVNGVTDVTLDNLDENLRLYFKERLVAENGIYITNKGTGQDSDDYWERVQNLESATLNSRIYKFGVVPGTETCYIQFPQDIGTLIGSGLKIKYVITSGEAGNIKQNVLTTLMNPTIKVGESDFDISADLVIKNASSAMNGSDPEDLDSAYSNYKKTVGTFDTLVTLRDYENYIYNLEDTTGTPVVSNVVVSDRTCDINRTTNVMTLTQGGNEKLVTVDSVLGTATSSNGTSEVDVLIPSMTAFDIGLYVLQDPGAIVNEYFYNRSFSVHDNIGQIQTLLSDVKSVNHDYIDTNQDLSSLYIFKNFYRLNGKVTTYYKVTQVQAAEIETNIKQALYKRYNARNVDFGKPVQYDDIIKTIQESDTRIKNVILAEPEYELKYMRVGDTSGTYSSAVDMVDRVGSGGAVTYLELLAKMILSGNVQLYKFQNDITFRFGQTDIVEYQNVSMITTVGEVDTTKTTDGHQVIVNDATSDSNKKGYLVPENINIQLLAPNYYTKTSYTAYVNYELLDASSNKWEECTESDDAFVIKQNTAYKLKVQAEGKIEFYRNSILVSTATPKDPIEIDETTYYIEASLVDSKNTAYFNVRIVVSTASAENTITKVEAQKLDNFVIPQNAYYKLGPTQSIFINYTDSNNTIVNTLLKSGTIVKFTDSSDSSAVLAQTKSTIEKVYNGVVHNCSTLTASQQLDVVDINQVVFDDKTLYAMWFTNKQEITETNGITTTTYTLFNDGQKEYILEDNEYFLYTNEERNELVILGSGTQLIRRNGTGKVVCDSAVGQSTIVSEGLSAISEDSWIKLSSGFTIRELQIVTLGKGAGFRCKSMSGTITNTPKSVTEPSYCEEFDPSSDSNSWIALSTFSTSADDGWKVRSKLNLVVGPDHAQTLSSTNSATNAAVTLMMPSSSVTIDGAVYRYMGNTLWSTPITKDITNPTMYKFRISTTEYTFTCTDITDFSTIQDITGGISYISDAGVFVLDGVKYWIVMKESMYTPTFSDGTPRSTSSVTISQGNIMSNNVLAFSGGDNRDVTSSSGNQIHVYNMNQEPLPSYSDKTLSHDENDEITISFPFYNEYADDATSSYDLSTDRPIDLHFSYEGTRAIQQSGGVTTQMTTYQNKEFIVPVVGYLNNTSVKVTPLTYDPTAAPANRYTADSDGAKTVSFSSESPVVYVRAAQTSSNRFGGIRISDWKLTNDAFSSRYKVNTVTSTTNMYNNAEKITLHSSSGEALVVKFVYHTPTSMLYWGKVSGEGGNESVATIGNRAYDSTKNNRFVIQSAGDSFGIYQLRKVTVAGVVSYYIYNLDMNDFIRVGKIRVIDTNDMYSDQVQETARRIALQQSTTIDDVMTSLQTLIGQASEFDISYVVPEQDSIDTSHAFETDRNYLFCSDAIWDPNHICNKYTIPQLVTDASKTSIKVSETSISSR